MHPVSFNSEVVFRPLLFDMYKGPLTFTESYVLDSGKHQ